MLVSSEQRRDSAVHIQGTLHFHEGWQEQTDVYVGYVMVAKFQVHGKQGWMRKGFFWASFKVFQRSQWYPNQKNHQNQRGSSLECSFPGPGPSSLTQDIWGSRFSGDGSCCSRDHRLGTTDGQTLPPLTKYLRTSSAAWTTAHSWLLPSVSGTLGFLLSCLQVISVKIGNCRMEMGGFPSCLWASSLPVISSVPRNLSLTLA